MKWLPSNKLLFDQLFFVITSTMASLLDFPVKNCCFYELPLFSSLTFYPFLKWVSSLKAISLKVLSHELRPQWDYESFFLKWTIFSMFDQLIKFSNELLKNLAIVYKRLHVNTQAIFVRSKQFSPQNTHAVCLKITPYQKYVTM